MAFRIDPWSTETIKEYNKLFEYFGIRPFKDIISRLEKITDPHIYMKRGIIFGHRDFELVLKAMEEGRKFAILTGLMPSGRMHFGHKMVIDQVLYYQKLGAEVVIVVADAEAYAVRKISRKELIDYALNEYIANYIALGLKRKNSRIYFQTNHQKEYYRLIQLFSRKVTMAELKATYGDDIDTGKIISVLTQMADILHLQLPEFGGFREVLVPVGPDQDPHLRLTRDVADRFSNELKLIPPASTYHRFMSGLDGGKMSSSRPVSYIALTDPPEVASKKIMNSLTGGRATAEEQRRLGGQPEKCPVYEMFAYHLISDDNELGKIYSDCKSGKMLCGECKRIAREKLVKFLADHQKKLKKAKDKVLEYVEPPTF